MTTLPGGQRTRPGGRRRPPARARAAIAVGRAAGALSRATGRGDGGTIPGRVALRLAPDLLEQLAPNAAVLLVSGTNGKTTTTRFLAAAMEPKGPVLTNADGANLVTGLASTLMRDRAQSAGVAVLEVDEVALTAAAAALRPAVLLLLNLSRDQLDRTNEVASHVTGWTRALLGAPGSTIVANADDPLVAAAVLGARPDAAGVVWVSAGQAWRQDSSICPCCHAPWAFDTADWRCVSCGFTRPGPSWAAADGQVSMPDGTAVAADLALPGRVNVANAAMVAAAAASLGIDVAGALDRMRTITDVAGRYWEPTHAGRRLRLLLAKNPAGWAEVLDQLDGTDLPVVVTVNAQYADGTDPSWLWDVPFEKLRGRRVVAAGERAADVSVRLLYSDVDHTTEPDALRAVEQLDGPRCEVAANYTAFRDIRNRLLRGQG